MRKWIRFRPIELLILVVAVFLAWTPALAQTFGAPPKDLETQKMVNQWNGECIACHTEQGVKFPPRPGMDLEKLGEALMDPFLYEKSQHTGMACKTCHGKGYVEYPHTVGAQAKILDCDECHAQLAFRVKAQFDNSVHAKNLSDHFSCNTCHDPHIDRLASELGDPQQIVEQDNGKCLECHNSDLKFAEYGGSLPKKKARPDIDAIHEFLPNTQRHWEAVRCVECHTPESTHSKLALSHEILNKDKAQRDCVTCHSQDTALRTRLYRHVAQEETQKMGFLNSAVLGDVYVIGATRNIYLDRLALWIVGLILAGVALHGFLRILTSLFRRGRSS
ncbi:MAG: cytochrome c3 family protein [Candidatus Thiodiazotropha sp. (ex Lucinoma annulata)]|nr:cytochrome c3 family protein [Candidatus Thiodiazotropha sp. (ex Lucinoma annulata)]